jgi:hypothetical protein
MVDNESVIQLPVDLHHAASTVRRVVVWAGVLAMEAAIVYAYLR